MRLIRVAPAAGRTVRFPAGHDLEGEPIPTEGALVDASSSFFKRYMLAGALVALPPIRAQAADAAPLAEPGQESIDFDPAELRKWTVKKLVETAQAAGIPIPPNAGKAELVKALTEAAEPIDNGNDERA